MIKRLSLTSVFFAFFFLAPGWAGDEESHLKNLQALLPKDAVRSIDAPKFVSAAEAIRLIDEAASVIGVVMEGEARAYPLSILSAHQIVNDWINGVPIAVSWDPLSYAAIVYDRRLGERTLTFGVSGELYANSFIT